MELDAITFGEVRSYFEHPRHAQAEIPSGLPRHGAPSCDPARLYPSARSACVIRDAAETPPLGNASEYRHFVEGASLIALMTAGSTRPECRLWGEAHAGVHFQNPNTLVLHERRATSDTGRPAAREAATATLLPDADGPEARWLRNVARDGRVRLLFVIAGVPWALRVSGRAHLLPAGGSCRTLDGSADAICRLSVSIDEAQFRRMLPQGLGAHARPLRPQALDEAPLAHT
jgi:hypothetical protein